MYSNLNVKKLIAQTKNELTTDINASSTNLQTQIDNIDVTQDASKSPFMLTFSFDDGYDSDYNIVFPILKKYNVRATFFVLGDMDWINSAGKAKPAELKEMAQAGQEIACHGHKHLPFANQATDEIVRNDMLTGKAIIESIIERPVYTHAYPYGGGDETVGAFTAEDMRRVESVASGIYEAARGTVKYVKYAPFYREGGAFGSTGMIYGDNNIYNVPCALRDDPTTDKIAIIDAFLANDEPHWHNLAFHRIYADDATDKPSNRMFAWQFEEFIAHAASLRDQGLVDIVPFYEGARRIRTDKSKHLV